MDNVIIVEKVGIWPNFVVWVRSPVRSVVEGGGGDSEMCALLNINLQQKQTKRKRERNYIHTNC